MSTFFTVFKFEGNVFHKTVPDYSVQYVLFTKFEFGL